MSRFDAHGDTSVSTIGRTLVFRPHGAANREEIERLLSVIDGLVPEFGGSSWASLIIAAADHVMTPDAEAALAQSATHLDRMRQAAAALVASDAATGRILGDQLRRAYAGTSCAVGLFATEGEATRWIAIRLALHG